MHHFRAYLAAFLSVTLLLCAVAPSYAATSADARAHADAASAARAKAAQQQALANKLKVQTAALDSKVAALQSQADALDPQITSATKRTGSIRSQIAALRSQIASESAQIASTTAQWQAQEGLLGERATATYKQGQWYYFDLLLGASDMRDFVARSEMVARLLKANSSAAEDLKATRLALEQQRYELERTQTDLAAKQAEALAVESGLKGLQDARQGKVDAQQSILDEKSSLLAASEKNAKHLLAVAEAEEAESARIKAELARAKRGSGKYHGVMAWPVPGFDTITSPFGWRMHPILKRRIFHAGIDISGPGISGAAIVAAGPGTVIAAGPRGGYGNVVMIDHGNGVVTVYGHQRDGGIKVSVGQHVKKGQRIGTVGSTGMSTGPHCHFEVRVNGTAVNPLGYL